MSDIRISLQCECYHRRGVLSALRGRPCRRCRRMMSRNVVVVPTQIGVAAATTTVVPVVVSTY